MKKYIILLLTFLILPFCILQAQAVQIGDTDANGSLSSADARLALRYSVQLENPDERARIAADADNDGRISAADARLILRVCIGLEQFQGDFYVDFIDVGQAKSILVTSGNNTMLIDGGNVADGENICDFLENKGIETLDYVVCTHAHEDHVGGLAKVLETFSVSETVFAPALTADTNCYEDFLNACADQKKHPVNPSLGATLSFGEATVQFYGPALADTTDLNDSSIVMKITYEDTDFLFTGDAETASEREMLNFGFDLAADVLDVGHHGSSSSTSYAFLNAVMPEIAVISCGNGNDYGHPHEEVISRLSDAGVITCRTDLHGTVSILSNGKALAVTTTTDHSVDVPEQPPQAEEYIGNINSLKFHLPTCHSLPSEQNRIYFANRETAIQNGYSPCGVCKP